MNNMEENTSRNIRLGLFVLVGTLFLIIAFYFIGSRQNLFGSTFRLSARFHNVNGLMQGNNVRFAGIDVGTVGSLEIENDSSVLVVMVLDKKVWPFIRKNAVASVGTDGLMGNKLVNIGPGGPNAPLVGEGDELKTLRPLEMDEMVRTLNVTNANMAVISSNLSGITARIGGRNIFWKLLMDTSVAENIKTSVGNLKELSAAGKSTAYNLKDITGTLNGERSGIRRLAADTALYDRIKRTLEGLERTSDSAGVISGNISGLVTEMKRGRGSIGRALTDTLLVYRLDKGLRSIDSAAASFNDNMIALKHTWPLKRYFKKKGRQRK